MAAAVLATGAAAHPSRGIVVDRFGRVVFSDLERIWQVAPDGRLSLLRVHPGIHTHALALAQNGDIYGEDSDYHPADQSYHEAIWRITPQGRFAYVYGPASTIARGIGLIRDGKCSYHADQVGRGVTSNRPLLHRQCRGRSVERLVGSAADDRAFQPVLLNDVAGTALGPEGSFYFRQGDAVRKLSPTGAMSDVARGLARENFGMTVDAEGNVYVAEAAARRIVRIASGGARSIVAATSGPWSPTGIAVRGGSLYLLEATDYVRGSEPRMRVRRVDAHGRSSTLATVSIPLQ